MLVSSSAAFRHGFLLAGLFSLSGGFSPCRAATTTVTVGDNFFQPSSVTINVNDKVRWTWTGFNVHSSTSNGGLWDSAVHGNGFAFTNTFHSAGDFPYHCTVHAFQTGSVTVQAANTLPTVSITSPANGATYAAPWSGAVQVSASDADGSILKVDLYAGNTRLSTISNPPPSLSFNVDALAAGDYALIAVAMDNAGATNSSAIVTVSVLAPAPIQITAPARLSAASFQFSYSATPGLRYIVQRSPDLQAWTPLVTNTAAANTEIFTDDNAAAGVAFYSVSLAPNP